MFSFIRRAVDGTEIVVVMNMSIYGYHGFRVGVQLAGDYKEIISSDNECYDGTGMVNDNVIKCQEVFCHNRQNSIVVDVAPLSISAFKTI